MRVALILYGTLDTLSGGYLYDRKMVDFLRARGHTVEVFGWRWRSWLRHLGDNFDWALVRKLADFAPDVVVQDELNHPSLFWLNRRLQSDLHAPIVSIVHHLRSSEEHPAALLPLYRTVERAYLRTVDAFVWNSQTTRSAVLSLLGYASNDAPASGVVIYPGIGDWASQAHKNVNTRQPDDVDAAAQRIIFVGNLIPRKRLDVLLHALQSAPHTWTLDVVGNLQSDVAHAAAMRTLAERLQLGERVRFHGKLDDAPLAQLMQRADLLVVPSYEGFGIVYLEAMSFGVPVIAASAGAAREIVRDGENGFLVPLGDAAEIARLLHRLAAKPALLQSLRQQALRTPQRFPTWEQGGAKLERWLLEQVARFRDD